MILIVFLLLCLPGIFPALKIYQILPNFSKDFSAPNPLPILSSGSREEKIDIIEFSSQNNLVVSWITQKPFFEKFLLVLLTQNEPIPNEDIGINQQIYFLTSSFEVFEQYLINDCIVMQKLGHYSNNIYVPEKVVSCGC